MADDHLNIRRALLSVWDKTDLIPLARLLSTKGVEIYATGKTFEVVQAAQIPVKRVEELTHFPEILGGRVKTLHPAVFGGILADLSNPQHQADLAANNLSAFQLVVINLYPFVAAYQAGKREPKEMVELIDIGGPAMLRAAAKNCLHVAVISNPDQYAEFSERFQNDRIDFAYRRQLAARVFEQTSAYDATIAQFLNPDSDPLPGVWQNHYRQVQRLRYGENPEQLAALYAPYHSSEWQPFVQLQGKEISFNNYIDCLAAFQLISEFSPEQPVVAILKHTNPCGVGTGRSPLEAYRRAVVTDPVSYFGGIVGINRPVDAVLAAELTQSFLECIVAPEYEEAALAILSKKKNLRLLIPNPQRLAAKLDIRQYGEGLLIQTVPAGSDDESSWQVVTECQPEVKHREAIRLAWRIVKHVKSNAIVICDDMGTLGIGAGQMSRVDAVKIAIRKAHEAGLSLKGAILASDAFFPFRDSVDIAAQEGIAGIIQPGGSLRDADSITACNEHRLFMLFTGRRVFKH